MSGRFYTHTTLSKFLTRGVDVCRPICPQIRKSRSPEEMLFGIPQDEMPVPVLKQDEFECLNLNIVCPAGLTPQSKVPVMLWIHGFVLLLFITSLNLMAVQWR